MHFSKRKDIILNLIMNSGEKHKFDKINLKHDFTALLTIKIREDKIE